MHRQFLMRVCSVKHQVSGTGNLFRCSDLVGSPLCRTAPFDHIFETSRTICTTQRIFAGHSHWKNVKGTKEARDSARADLMQRVCYQLRWAVKEHGSADPKQNPALNKIIDYAKSESLPFDRIKTTLANLANRRPELFTLEAKGPGGSLFVMEFLSDNANKTKADMRALFKKFPAQIADGNASVGIRFNFEYKGVLTTKQAGDAFCLDKAEEDAIEAGAEEVSEGPGEKEIVFICDSIDLVKVAKALEIKGYKILDSSSEYIPKQTVDIQGPAREELDKLMERLHEHADIAKVYCNWI